MSVRPPILAALVLVSSLAMAPAPAALAADAVDPVAPQAMTVPVGAEPDGTPVRLDVSVWPQVTGRHPVVLLAHGFGGTKESVASQADDLHARGYVVITWNDLADAFFPQAAVSAPATTAAGRTPVATPGPFKQVWASNFFLSGLRGGAATGADGCGRFDPTICRLFVRVSETGTPSAQLTALLRAHSPKPTMNSVTAP